MEIVKTKDKEFLDLVMSSLRPNENSLSRISDVNRRSLQELVRYLTKLKSDTIIDDKLFSELVLIACANYIENEVESRISNSIDKRIMFFFENLK